jgi:hypothetical protein
MSLTPFHGTLATTDSGSVKMIFYAPNRTHTPPVSEQSDHFEGFLYVYPL